jgi:hypothetical protein
LPNWDIEGGFCNIGPLRRGLFFIFALQKSKKHLALLVSIRWTLFQTPTGAKRETVMCHFKNAARIQELNAANYLQIFPLNYYSSHVTFFKVITLTTRI